MILMNQICKHDKWRNCASCNSQGLFPCIEVVISGMVENTREPEEKLEPLGSALMVFNIDNKRH